MKKSFIFLITTFLLLIGTGGCTQPDGYIGKWFGSWHLESIEINGEPDQEYEQSIIISFQGKIVSFVDLNKGEIFGSWSYAGEVLTLVANYNAGNDLPNVFNPFPIVMHLPADVDQVEITVTKITSSMMQWQYIDQNGRLLTYNFKKYP